MKKYNRWLIISVLVVAPLCLLLYLYNIPSAGTVPIEASSRAIELVPQSTTELSDTKDTLIATDCLKFIMPFTHTNIKSEFTKSSCGVFLRLLNPTGQFNLNISKDATNIHELSSVKFRKSLTETYAYEILRLGNISEVLKFTASDSINFFFRANDRVVTISFTYIANTNNIKNENVETIINSLSYE